MSRPTLAPDCRWPILAYADVLRIPKPSWLIDGVLPSDALTVLYGSPKGGKTFTAIDWTFAVATGTPWLGHAVRQGSVIYVAAEGASGLSPRFRARAQRLGITDVQCFDGITVVPRPVYLVNRLLRSSGAGASELDDTAAFIEQVIKPIQPKLVVIDTLARSLFGGDEDSSRDMGLLVEAADRIRHASPGSTVLLIHHDTKNGRSMRGSSALFGALNTLIRFKRLAGNIVTLECVAQKDAAPFDPPVRFQLQQVTLPDGETSLIPAAIDPAVTATLTAGDEKVQRVLQALGAFGEGPVETKDWYEAVSVAAPLSRSRFNDYRAALIEDDLVVLATRGKYQLTERGAAELGRPAQAAAEAA